MLQATIDAMVERVETLNLDEELECLARHARVAGPTLLDRLARAHAAPPAEEARRIAVAQLRMLESFALQLRWLEALTADSELDLGVRAGLTAILIRVCSETELRERTDSHAAALLEPALLLHGLLAHLRPWLPSFIPTDECETEFEVLRLGVPDYMLLVLHDRFADTWALFHRLRQATWLVHPDALATMPSDLELFERDPRVSELPIPTTPTWPPTSELVPALAKAVGG